MGWGSEETSLKGQDLSWALKDGGNLERGEGEF